MKCVVKKEDSDQIVVSHTGRRQRKQTAKKLAAFRALREMKELGYRYISFEERNDESPKKEAEKVGTVTLSDKDASLVKVTQFGKTNSNKSLNVFEVFVLWLYYNQ